jgi:hypothetical protein
MEINILGPPELLVAGPQEITVSPQLWCVLVSLLLTPNVSVSAEVLVDRYGATIRRPRPERQSDRISGESSGRYRGHLMVWSMWGGRQTVMSW